jgi:hypothetical protein
MPKIEVQWPGSVLFCVACVTLGALVYKGTIHPEALFALLAMLAPAPWKPSAPQGTP